MNQTNKKKCLYGLSRCWQTYFFKTLAGLIWLPLDSTKKKKVFVSFIFIVMISPIQFVNQSWQCFNYQCVRVRFPYGALLTLNKGKARNLWCVNVNVCPESFACQHEDSGEMRCDTRAHTCQVVAVVALMILRAYGSPGETQLLVPDVDCKYPTVVCTTQVGVWLSLHALSCYFTLCVIHSLAENFPALLHYKAAAQ